MTNVRNGVYINMKRGKRKQTKLIRIDLNIAQELDKLRSTPYGYALSYNDIIIILLFDYLKKNKH